ncbi:MAG: FKBP-type peptidyl-prolyl cis-trans isomerase [Sporichthyaceae bacterium]
MTPVRTRRPKFAALALCAALALTGCGSDDEEVDQAGSGAGAPAAGAPSGGASGGVPEVSNATDLKTEPVIAKGTGSPPTTLQTKDLVVGEGKTAEASHTVSVRYVGALYVDGTVFDSSWKAGDAPIDFPLSGVVPGFAQGIEGMKEGGRRTIVIPSELGYGSRGAGAAIPPNATLVFVVDLVTTG